MLPHRAIANSTCCARCSKATRCETLHEAGTLGRAPLHALFELATKLDPSYESMATVAASSSAQYAGAQKPRQPVVEVPRGSTKRFDRTRAVTPVQCHLGPSDVWMPTVEDQDARLKSKRKVELSSVERSPW